ncbi:hypothetical protein [Streptomyces ochraceiscleroticus]|uniref:Uncharacterized protein n=1 Tax=Streptomyces ochraceiscleroticus TaxID=47761 RepID=A0ABW1MKE2_9ACTN|nr:hypothetical protein [Streptomyces ochraceiscleroticus]
MILFPDAGTELSHQQGVGAQIVEEVTVDRHSVDMYDACHDLGEGIFDGNRRITPLSLCDVARGGVQLNC